MACIAAIAMGSLATAQSFPSKSVRFIIPFAPGGGNDIIGRAIAAKLSEQWKQQMIVDNRPGAGGNVAGEITARAAPDGYTVFQFNIANVIAASLYPKLSYDPVHDFEPVTQIGSSPFLVTVHPTLRANNVRERMSNQGIELVADTPQEFARFIRAELPKWARAVKASGARVD